VADQGSDGGFYKTKNNTDEIGQIIEKR